MKQLAGISLFSDATPAVEQAMAEKLDRYVALMGRWKSITNLISDKAFDEIWTRHITDSFLIQSTSKQSRLWLDIGSGSGLPGIVIAIILHNLPGAAITCVEPDGRKSAFLREVSSTLELPVRVIQERIERLAPARIGQIDAVTARAYSTVPRILRDADPFLRSGAVAILPRGASFEQELAEINKGKYRIELPAARGYAKGRIAIIELLREIAYDERDAESLGSPATDTRSGESEGRRRQDDHDN